MHLLSKHAQAVCQWIRDNLSDESCYAELKMPSMSQNVACYLSSGLYADTNKHVGNPFVSIDFPYI